MLAFYQSHLFLFRLPEPKIKVSFSDHLLSVRLSVRPYSYYYILLCKHHQIVNISNCSNRDPTTNTGAQRVFKKKDISKNLKIDYSATVLLITLHLDSVDSNVYKLWLLTTPGSQRGFNFNIEIDWKNV